MLQVIQTPPRRSRHRTSVSSNNDTAILPRLHHSSANTSTMPTFCVHQDSTVLPRLHHSTHAQLPIYQPHPVYILRIAHREHARWTAALNHARVAAASPSDLPIQQSMVKHNIDHAERMLGFADRQLDLHRARIAKSLYWDRSRLACAIVSKLDTWYRHLD